MAFSATNSQIFAPLFSDPEMAAIFSDDNYVRQMLVVEAALAKVEGQLGIIPSVAADKIVAATAVFQPDYPALQKAINKAGVPVVELLRQLRLQLSDDAADFVHWGATTQDVMDTAVILQSKAALTHIENQLNPLLHSLATLADKHRYTLMAGRTHSQQALPIPFGLKVANWLAPLLRHRQRLVEMKPRLLVVQLGGAVGTLAAFGELGTAVQQALTQELQLNAPPIPWHTQRDNLAELASWLSLVSGSLAKMAQDIILMGQSEVGELRESGDGTRGGSSTMPQKANPIISENIIAAARTNASLLGNMHQAQIQEHERGTHGWQMEWLTLPQMFALTGSSLNKTLFLSENLAVDVMQMKANVASSQGLMLAEAVSFALAETMGRTKAKKLVGQACQIALSEDRHLIEVVRDMTAVTIDWQTIQDESNYLGVSDILIDQVLQAAKETT